MSIRSKDPWLSCTFRKKLNNHIERLPILWYNSIWLFLYRKKQIIIKATVYILCVYILLLAVMPCADIHDCGYPDRTECALMQAHNDDNDNCMDKCSPLCVCNCCMAAVAQIKEVHFDFVDRPLPAENNTLYLFGISYEVIKLVLQPPRTIWSSIFYFILSLPHTLRMRQHGV